MEIPVIWAGHPEQLRSNGMMDLVDGCHRLTEEEEETWDGHHPGEISGSLLLFRLIHRVLPLEKKQRTSPQATKSIVILAWELGRAIVCIRHVIVCLFS